MADADDCAQSLEPFQEAAAEWALLQPRHHARWLESAARAAARQPDLLAQEAVEKIEKDIMGAVLHWIARNKKRAHPQLETGPAVDKELYQRMDDERRAAADVATAYYKRVRHEKLELLPPVKLDAGGGREITVPVVVTPATRPTIQEYASLHGLDITLRQLAVKRTKAAAVFESDNARRVPSHDAFVQAKEYALVDENRFPFELYVTPSSPDALSAKGRVGLRVCVLLHFVLPLLHEKDGFMKDCYSTGRPCGRNLNWALKDAWKRRAWGLINKLATFKGFTMAADCVSGRGEYSNKKGADKSYQMSTCASRNKTTKEELHKALRRCGRGAYEPYLGAYFDDMERISQKYSGALSANQDGITSDMLEHARYPRPKLHTQVLESDGKFGSVTFHLDAHAAFANLIANTDVYPEGFHEYRCGQYVDGVTGFAQATPQGGVRLTRGDKRAHFVLPPLPPLGEHVAPLPALRFAMVHSPDSHAGVQLADVVHRMVDHHAAVGGVMDDHLMGITAEHADVVRAMTGQSDNGARSRARSSDERVVRMRTLREQLLSDLDARMALLAKQLSSGGRVGNRIALYPVDLRDRGDRE